MENKKLRENLHPLGIILLGLFFSSAGLAQSPANVPVFESTPLESKFKFDVEVSVPIKGTFDKWDATLTFTSRELATGVLNIMIQADSVDTGNGMKNEKLKGKDLSGRLHRHRCCGCQTLHLATLRSGTTSPAAWCWS